VKRMFDVFLSAIALGFFFLPILFLSCLVKLTSRGPVFYWSDRVGRDNEIFRMPKFRTMRPETPPRATHLLTDPHKYLTPIGAFLRKSSLDEIPQLYSIILGDMSFVGPRPALFNQDDLVALRTKKGIHLITPGLTGWAQVKGRDELPIPQKVEYDEYYLHNMSLAFDLRILIMTFYKVIRIENVHH
jgi:O-antigen biosynthesis protein WbqP